MKLDFINNNLMRFDFQDGLTTVTETVAPGFGGLVSFASNLFKNDTQSDWKNWDRDDLQRGETKGNSVRGWVLNGFSSAGNDPNEDVKRSADNIASYINSNSITTLLTGNPPYMKGVDYTKANGTGWRDVTIEEIARKLRLGGKVDQADKLSSYAKGTSATPSNAPAVLAQNATQSNLQNAPANTDATAAAAQAANKKSTQTIVIVALVVLVLIGVAVYFLRKKK